MKEEEIRKEKKDIWKTVRKGRKDGKKVEEGNKE